MTGDDMVKAPGWQAYVTGEKIRHAFAHRAVMVSHEQASSFIDAAEQVLDHVFNVMGRSRRAFEGRTRRGARASLPA